MGADIREQLVEATCEDDLLFADGFDDCILGIVERFGIGRVVLYDREKVLAKLQADEMTYEEAVEYFEFNIIGAWMGETTPAFATLLHDLLPPP